MINNNQIVIFRIFILYIKCLLFYEKVINFINPVYIFYITENLNISLPLYLYTFHLKSLT